MVNSVVLIHPDGVTPEELQEVLRVIAAVLYPATLRTHAAKFSSSLKVRTKKVKGTVSPGRLPARALSHRSGAIISSDTLAKPPILRTSPSRHEHGLPDGAPAANAAHLLHTETAHP